MTDFEVDMELLTRTVYMRRSPFLGTICLDPVNCNTCREVQSTHSSRMERGTYANELRRTVRIFVNAVDLTETSLGYPIHIFMLPRSAFTEILHQFTGLYELDPSINIVHPERGNNILIEKTGLGLQTRYRTQISMPPDKLPNNKLFDELICKNKTGLYSLNGLERFFDEEGHLRRESPIVKLEEGINRIRILPPYDESRQIHAEYGFHFTTLEQLREREEQNDRTTLSQYSNIPITERTQSTVPNTSLPPRQSRELMMPEPIDPYNNEEPVSNSLNLPYDDEDD